MMGDGFVVTSVGDWCLVTDYNWWWYWKTTGDRWAVVSRVWWWMMIRIVYRWWRTNCISIEDVWYSLSRFPCTEFSAAKICVGELLVERVMIANVMMNNGDEHEDTEWSSGWWHLVMLGYLWCHWYKSAFRYHKNVTLSRRIIWHRERTAWKN